jgi:phage-related minor tail protein
MATTDEPIETWTVKVTADTSDLESKLTSTTRAGRQLASTLVSAFDDIAVKGKNVGDVFKSLALSVSNLALKSALQPLTTGLASMFQSVLSGATTPFAKGGVIQQGTPVPFASGGIIASPISFPLAGGATGLAGEKGPEAIMPLTRSSDGRLGVAMAGGGQQVTINITTPDAQSFNRSQSQIAAMIARAAASGQRNL